MTTSDKLAGASYFRVIDADGRIASIAIPKAVLPHVVIARHPKPKPRKAPKRALGAGALDTF